MLFVLGAWCVALVGWGVFLTIRPRTVWNWRMSTIGWMFRGRRPEPSDAALLVYRLLGLLSIVIGAGLGVAVWWLAGADRIE